MKKITSLILAIAFILCLCACGGNTSSTTAPDTSTTQPSGSSGTTDTAETPEEPTVSWPNGDITILIPSQAGSNTDLGVRIIADWIAEQTGVNVQCVNNDAGAGSVLAKQLMEAEPDGQTLMYLGGSNINAYYKGNWDFNIAEEGTVTPIAASTQPNPDCGCLIMTQTDQPFNTLEELIAYAEEHPGELTAACASGSVMELKMRSLFNYVGLSENVRYVSSSFSDAVVGLLGGNIDLIIGEEGAAYPYIQDGSAKAIISCRTNDFDPADWYTGDALEIIAPIPSLTDVLGEEAAQEVVIAMRCFIAGPAGMDPELVKVIADCINAIAEDEGAFQERIKGLGGTTHFPVWSPEFISEYLPEIDAKIAAINGVG